MDDHLSVLLRHYAALSPSSPALLPSPPFPSPSVLSRAATQQYLVDHFLAPTQPTNSVEEDEDGARGWKKVFWRRVVKGIEAGFDQRRSEGDAEVEDEEVHPDILEAMVDFLSSGSGEGAPGVSTRRYYWGDLKQEPGEWQVIRTREEGRLISGGTTGLRTWQACIALSNHLLASPSILTSTSTILELGAGVGLLSLVSARLLQPASGETERRGKIVATDVDEQVLRMLEGNIALNDLSGLAEAKKLDWELASDPAAGHEALEAWERETFGGGVRPEVLLGADIVYDPSLATHLAATLAWLLRPAPSGASQPQALIAGTIRNLSTWELFLSECRARQLEVEPVELQAPAGKSGLVGAEGWEGEGEVRLVRIVAAAPPKQ
ncbi:hypothetical protein JCM10207_003401 [Rhodosporidiobolus poonsookiae]